MECSYKLRMQGKPYPRTCKVHGLTGCRVENNAERIQALLAVVGPEFDQLDWSDQMEVMRKILGITKEQMQKAELAFLRNTRKI